jgi:hypothetical protein
MAKTGLYEREKPESVIAIISVSERSERWSLPYTTLSSKQSIEHARQHIRILSEAVVLGITGPCGTPSTLPSR